MATHRASAGDAGLVWREAMAVSTEQQRVRKSRRGEAIELGGEEWGAKEEHHRKERGGESR
jgi:hypothetical protein